MWFGIVHVEICMLTEICMHGGTGLRGGVKNSPRMGYVQRALYGEEYSQAVLDQLRAVPKSMLVDLFDSMPKRMARVIELHGDKTKY